MNKSRLNRVTATLTLTALFLVANGTMGTSAQEATDFKLRSHPAKRELSAAEEASAPDYAKQLQALEDELRIERAKREVLREDLEKARLEIAYLSDTIVQMKREQISFARKLEAVRGSTEPADRPQALQQPDREEGKRVTRRSWRYLQNDPAQEALNVDTNPEPGEEQPEKPSILKRLWPFGKEESRDQENQTAVLPEPNRAPTPMLPGEQLDSSETLSGRVTAPSAFSSAAGNDLFKRACAAYELGRLQQAAGLCDQFLENEPHHAQALGLRGIVALGENDLQNASLFLRRALREEQNDALLHSYMGVVLHAQGKHRAAVRELHEAVMLNPKNSEIHFNLAVVQATAPRGNLQEARDAYEMALSLGNRRDQALESIVYP